MNRQERRRAHREAQRAKRAWLREVMATDPPADVKQVAGLIALHARDDLTFTLDDLLPPEGDE